MSGKQRDLAVAGGRRRWTRPGHPDVRAHQAKQGGRGDGVLPADRSSVVGGITTQGQYFVFLIFPMAVAATRLRSCTRFARVALFGLLLAVLNWQATMESPWLDQHLLVKVLANNLPFFGLLVLGGWFVAELRRHA